jgi:hypothetical protein
MRDDEGDTYEVRFVVPEGDDAEIVADVNRL